MIVALIIFLIFVRENKWAREMRETTEKYNLMLNQRNVKNMAVNSPEANSGH